MFMKKSGDTFQNCLILNMTFNKVVEATDRKCYQCQCGCRLDHAWLLKTFSLQNYINDYSKLSPLIPSRISYLSHIVIFCDIWYGARDTSRAVDRLYHMKGGNHGRKQEDENIYERNPFQICPNLAHDLPQNIYCY